MSEVTSGSMVAMNDTYYPMTDIIAAPVLLTTETLIITSGASKTDRINLSTVNYDADYQYESNISFWLDSVTYAYNVQGGDQVSLCV